MQVRLTRKLAERIDGVDISHHKVGDIFELPLHDAQLLIAEGWAHIYIVEVEESDFGKSSSPHFVTFATGYRAGVADLSSRVLRTLDRIRPARSGPHSRMQMELRRAEDGIREELHDESARTILVPKARA